MTASMNYEVFDLGAHEVLAQFRNERDAIAWAQITSAYGPALQVRPLQPSTTTARRVTMWIDSTAKLTADDFRGIPIPVKRA